MTTPFSHSLRATLARIGGSSTAALVAVLWRRYRRHSAWQRTARQLESLDDRTLKDIGLGRGEIVGVAQQLAEQRYRR